MNRLIVILLFGLTISCGKGLSPDAYIQYIEGANYPYRITKTFGDKTFTLIYTPNDYLILKQLSISGNFDKERFNQEMNTKKDYLHFIFMIENNRNEEAIVSTSSDLANYSNNLMYMVNDLQFDFTLRSSGTDQPCVFANYERNYGLTNKNNIQVVFNKTNTDKKFKIIYNDQLFNLGPVVFDFDIIKNKKVNI
jgi:hypothetical protein